MSPITAVLAVIGGTGIRNGRYRKHVSYNGRFGRYRKHRYMKHYQCLLKRCLLYRPTLPAGIRGLLVTRQPVYETPLYISQYNYGLIEIYTVIN